MVDLVRNAHFLIAHAAFVPIPVRHETLERERDVPRAHFQRLDRAPHARVAVQTAHNPIADPVPWFQKSFAPTARPALFGRVELEVPLGHLETTNKKLHAQEVLSPIGRRIHHLFGFDLPMPRSNFIAILKSSG